MLLDDGRGLLALDQRPAGPTGLLDLVLGTPGLDRAVAGVVVDPADLRLAADSPAGRRVALGVRVGWAADADLRAGLARAVAAGARFARTAMVVTDLSGRADLEGSAHRCASVARAGVAAGLVPVVECVVAVPPRCGLDGARTRHATALAAVTAALRAAGVAPADLVLCTSLAQPGPRGEVAGADEIAAATVAALTSALTAARLDDRGPAAVAFRPTGQPRHLAANLAALRGRDLPWPVGFCVGASVLEPVAQAWQGRSGRVPDARRELTSRLSCLVAVLRATRPYRVA